jgi:hypothetical protein
MAFSAANALAAGEILVEGSATLATGRTVGAKQKGEGAIIGPEPQYRDCL